MTNVAERRPQGARRARLAALATIAAALISVEARAVTPEDRAAADQLFNDGRAAVKTGNYEVGCAKLASSQALDPTSGTLLALGDCYELAGRTASAWATFSDAAAMAANAKDQAREEEATRRADALAPRLSKLVVELPADEKSAADLKVVRNGKPMEVSTLGAAIPVDPGNQKVEVTLPGRKPWSGEVTVPFGPGTTTLVVPALERVPHTSSPEPTPPPKDVAPTSSWNGQKTAGIVVGAIGIVGLGVGIGFGAATLAKVGSIADDHLCDESDPPKCVPAGIEAHADANTLANVSNVSLAVGGAALVTGIIVFATAPRGSKAPPSDKQAAVHVEAGASPFGAHVALRGAF